MINDTNKVTFYVDESGNTGSNWLDKQQPYFIYGGWVVKDEEKSDVDNLVRAYLKNGKELKSKNFFSSHTGYKKFDTLFNDLIGIGAVPIFAIVEKKYMVAAKIVETFFDCDYNPNINEYLTAPYPLKRALADCIYECEDILISFSKLINNGTISVDELRRLSIDLVDYLCIKNLDIVANTIHNLKTENFEAMIKEFEVITRQGNEMKWITLTQTTLVEMLRSLELFCLASNSRANVIHDELFSYDAVFKEIEEIFIKGTMPDLSIFSDKIMINNFTRINSIKMTHSENELMVQAADLLCGFVNSTLKSIQNKKNILSNESILTWLNLINIHDFFGEMGIIVWNYYATDELLHNLTNKIMKNDKTYQSDYMQIVECDFKKAIKDYN